MPGIATHFKILELTIDQLTASGDPQLQNIGNIMHNNSPWTYLGAVGPALADFIPSDNSNIYSAIWKTMFQIIGGDGSEANPGLLKIFETFEEFFARIQPILDDEDQFALKDMQDNGDIDKVSAAAAALTNLLTNLNTPTGIVSTIQSQIGPGLRPILNFTMAPSSAAPDLWTAREFLFWRKSGDFAKALLDKATALGDDRFKAYAYGYISSYAGCVSGAAFINSVIGGTYRSDWWRYRWIDNFVDAWVYGFYESNASMSGDTPTPAYENWRGLCNAQLQRKIELPGLDPDAVSHNLLNIDAQIIPTEFENFWYSAFDSVYGVRGPASRFKPNSLNGAYLMTWMVLWFQTSGSVVGCNPPPPPAPPEGADPQPSWVDPADGSIAPTPTPEGDVDEGKVITGAILALLGLAAIIFGGIVLGAAAIAGGVALIIDGATELNWTKLRSDIYWLQMYFYNGLKALHEIFVLAGFQHPYPSVLQTGDAPVLLGIPFAFDAAAVNCKSRSLKDRFPAKPWDGTVSLSGLWIARPNRGTEEPATTAYLTGDRYPNYFINDPGNPLSNGKISEQNPLFTAPDGARYRLASPGQNLPIQFGNAVENTIDLLKANLFPNWNLDGDRGLAYTTWKFVTGYSDPVVIQPE